MHLLDDGLCVASPNAAGYDDEGVRRRRNELFRDGMLVGALHSTTTARAMGGGAETTGNAVRPSHKSAPRAAPAAPILQPTGSLGELFATAEEATYLAQLSGTHSGINPVSGRVNVGVSAYGCGVVSPRVDYRPPR